jgi:DNA primase
MAKIKIRGRWVDVDIRAELERFSWQNARWTDTKLIAASPFRYDRKPSFFVNLDGMHAGTWGDSGAYDSEWRSGNFVKLLAFLRNETYEETEEYLLAEYTTDWDYDKLTLKPPTLRLEGSRYLNIAKLDEFQREQSDYLTRRGISAEVQRLMRTGYDAKKHAIVIPWFDGNGRLCNIKYRSVYGKTFWYERGAIPIRRLVYGIDVIFAKKVREAAICEAEIDAMSWWTIGIPAIAVGGVTFTDEQADIIKRSPIERLILSADNDKAGEKLTEQVAKKLGKYIELYKVDFGRYKDANEALSNGVLPKIPLTIQKHSTKYDIFRPFSF